MEAKTSIIEEKLRELATGLVRPADFRTRDGEAIDSRTLLQEPNFTLYCLDFENRQALFVETPPECILSRAPFMYLAQYDAAVRLVQVPLDTLHQLASEVVIDPSRLIFIYSIGRCGSTLVSRAYQEIEGVENLSEPDVFSQMLGTWGPNHLEGDEKAKLLKSCTLMQCAPGRRKGATSWALKFRSRVTEMAPFFSSIYPEAKVIFLYRNVEPWARSFMRVMGVSDPFAPIPVAGLHLVVGSLGPKLDSRPTVSALEMLAHMWLSPMEKCLELQRRGIPVFVARYEELNAAPRDVLARMFSFSGIDASAVSKLDAVLAQDSQAETPLSRTLESKVPLQGSHEWLEQLRQLIRKGSRDVTAETILPGTYFPASQIDKPPM